MRERAWWLGGLGVAAAVCAALFVFHGGSRQASSLSLDSLAVTAPALPPLPALPDAAVPVPQFRPPAARLSSLAGE
ncbi:MAG: hypothetical protein PW734_03300 [Verrucomicrobium sp.]|nr:hypothetical protein [Verrucomicrobium sp.]